MQSGVEISPGCNAQIFSSCFPSQGLCKDLEVGWKISFCPAVKLNSKCSGFTSFSVEYQGSKSTGDVM